MRAYITPRGRIPPFRGRDDNGQQLALFLCVETQSLFKAYEMNGKAVEVELSKDFGRYTHII